MRVAQDMVSMNDTFKLVKKSTTLQYMTSVSIQMNQIRPICGDIDHNTNTILAIIQDASADVMVFPELSVTGYPATDLLFHPDVQSECMMAIQRIQYHTKGQQSLVIIGAPVFHNNQCFNAALCICNGQIIHRYYKQRLPNGGVFNDSRYFTPGNQTPIVTWNNQTFAVVICEDIWTNNVHEHPLANDVNTPIDCVFHIAASPFEATKHHQRIHWYKQVVQLVKAPLISVNQIGAFSDIIFDGSSIAMCQSGTIVKCLPQFQAESVTVNLPFEAINAPLTPKNNMQVLHDALCFGIREFMQRSGISTCVIGLSGGIDSAVVACLAVHALGPEHVLLVGMPTQYNSKETQSDARVLADQLNTRFILSSIEDLRLLALDKISQAVGGVVNAVTQENLQARLRGLLLMGIANNNDAVVLSTGNKSELCMGYATLYGDMCGALNPIGDIFKTDVFRLANYIHNTAQVIPLSIIQRPPSAELRENQKDSDSLPDYSILDDVLHRFMIQKQSIQSIQTEIPGVDVSDIIQRMKRQEFKRYQSPPILTVSGVAFGRGWKLEVTP